MGIGDDEILGLVAPEFQDDFVRFIQTGAASRDFLDYLDRDEKCQDATELALAEGTQFIVEAIDLIRREVANSGPKLAPGGIPEN